MKGPIRHVEGNRKGEVREALNLVLVTRVDKKAVFYYTLFPEWQETLESDYWKRPHRVVACPEINSMQPGKMYLIYSVAQKVGEGFTRFGQEGKFEWIWMKMEEMSGSPHELAAQLKGNHRVIMNAYRAEQYPNEIEFENRGKPGLLEF